MTPLQKSIAEIEALHAAYDGMDNARTVVSHVLDIITTNLDYERDVIEKAHIYGQKRIIDCIKESKIKIDLSHAYIEINKALNEGDVSANDYYTKTYEHDNRL